MQRGQFVHGRQYDDWHGVVLGSQGHRVGSAGRSQTSIGQDTVRADDYLDHLAIEKPVGAVLFDIHLDLSYVELAKAIRHLQENEDCQLIAGGSDVIMPLAENLNVAGFFDFLEHVKRYTQREATFLGKPSPLLGEMFNEMFEIREPKRCIFIGDTLVQDVQFGKACGFQSLLVLSGCLTKEDMLNAPVEAQPDYYADSLADFTQLLENIKK